MALLLASPALRLHLHPSSSSSLHPRSLSTLSMSRMTRTAKRILWMRAQAPHDQHNVSPAPAEECELVSGNDLTLQHEDGEDDELDAHLVKAVKNNNGLGVVLLSDVLGFSEPETKDFAYRLACFGYNVLIPDVFRGDPWTNEGEFEEWRARQPMQRVAKDIDLSTKWLTTQLGNNKKLGLIGFCYGGGRALETIARNTQAFGAAVSFYGTRFDTSLGDKISIPLLFILGDKDPLCSVQVAEETRRRSNHQHFLVKVYPGRGHAFVHRPQSAEEDEDAEDAFSTMQSWLQKHLS